MKIKVFFSALVTIVSINRVNAQFNNGFGGNGLGRNNGMNQMGSISQATEPEKPKEIPPQEIAARYIEEMKPDVGLDELQIIAISNVLIETIRAEGRMMKLNLPQEDLIKEHKLLSENSDRKVMDFLNKEQKEKYLAFKEKMRSAKKPSKKDKKKKDKIEQEIKENKE